MSGAFRQAWDYLPTELWEPLSDFRAADNLVPPGLYSDLFNIAEEYLSPSPTAQDLEEIRNNSEAGRQRFLSLKGTDFASEAEIVYFLEAVFELLGGYDIAGFADYYSRLLSRVLSKLNLRYRIHEPFSIRFLIDGSFTNLYAELRRVNSGDPHLAALLEDFEKSFDRYVRTLDSTDLKTCIAKASNYVEGLASATRGAPGTLGSLCDQLTDWPHEKVKESLKSLYKYCSDYPGIRHAGNPQGVKRPLASRDVTLAALLLLSFTGYLTPSLNEATILGT